MSAQTVEETAFDGTRACLDAEHDPIPVKNTFIHFDDGERECEHGVFGPSGGRVKPKRRMTDSQHFYSTEEVNSSEDSAKNEYEAIGCSTPRDFDHGSYKGNEVDDCADATEETLTQTPDSRLSLWSSCSSPCGSPRKPVSPPVTSACLSADAPVFKPASSGGDGAMFTFAIRKADNVQLGLNITPSVDNGSFVIEDVLKDGAVMAWNKQVADSAKKVQALRAGDVIVAINGATSCNAMLNEMKTTLFMRMTVHRPGRVEGGSANR